jgi:hypothetical protein
MTPEKILELLPKAKKAHTYASENADFYMGQDEGYERCLTDCANALAGKVVLKEDFEEVEGDLVYFIDKKTGAKIYPIKGIAPNIINFDEVLVRIRKANRGKV